MYICEYGVSFAIGQDNFLDFASAIEFAFSERPHKTEAKKVSVKNHNDTIFIIKTTYSPSIKSVHFSFHSNKLLKINEENQDEFLKLMPQITKVGDIYFGRMRI